METRSWLKAYIIQVIPIISFVVYIIGFTYYLAYYYHFGVNIISFITLQEVLVSTFIPISGVILLSLMYYACAVITRNAQKNSKMAIKLLLRRLLPNRKGSKRKLPPKQEEHRHKLNLMMSPFGFAAFAMIIPYYIYTDGTDIKHQYTVMIFSMMFSSIFISMYMREYAKLRFSMQRFYYNASAISVVAIATIATTIYTAYHNAEMATRENNTKFCVMTEDKSQYTDRTHTYIGECANAVFLYDKETESTLVLNMEHITGIVYKEKQSSVYIDIMKDLSETGQEMQLR